MNVLYSGVALNERCPTRVSGEGRGRSSQGGQECFPGLRSLSLGQHCQPCANFYWQATCLKILACFGKCVCECTRVYVSALVCELVLIRLILLIFTRFLCVRMCLSVDFNSIPNELSH